MIDGWGIISKENILSANVDKNFTRDAFNPNLSIIGPFAVESCFVLNILHKFIKTQEKAMRKFLNLGFAKPICALGKG